MEALTAIYIVWNNEELLDGSIQQIYKDVDDILIVWQAVSNYGNENPNLLPELYRLKEKYGVRLLEFAPNLHLQGKQNEIRKVGYGINNIVTDYFILMNCDHFYEPDKFRQAKETFFAGGYDGSATKMFTYYKFPDCRLEKMESYYCPFIHKKYPNLMSSPNRYPVYVDPALAFVPCHKFLEYPAKDFIMHHLSWIRKDVRSKLENASSKINWEGKIESFIKEFESHKHGDYVSYYRMKTIKTKQLFKI